jgi:hypothetical protein
MTDKETANLQLEDYEEYILGDKYEKVEGKGNSAKFLRMPGLPEELR